jgi:hypothetical protein
MTDDVRFKDLDISDTFQFRDAPTEGPYVKVSPRKYSPIYSPSHIFGLIVGTIHARVVVVKRHRDGP